jgi:hypothetical protein
MSRARVPASVAVRATELWTERMVIGQKMCPYANGFRGATTTRRVVANTSPHIEAHIEQIGAELLRLANDPKLHTTLVVAPNLDLTPLGAMHADKQGEVSFNVAFANWKPNWMTMASPALHLRDELQRDFIKHMKIVGHPHLRHWLGDSTPGLTIEQALEFVLVTFHPGSFILGMDDRPIDPSFGANYRARTPYPTCHILRRSDIEWAEGRAQNHAMMPELSSAKMDDNIIGRNTERFNRLGAAKLETMLDSCIQDALLVTPDVIYL